MELTNVQLLLITNYLHYFSAGLLAPILTPYISANGGNHIILGFLISTLFICSKFSKSFVILFEHGKKFALNFCLYSSCLSYLLLIANSNYLVICLTRCFYTLTNQVSFYSKEYIAKTELGNAQIKPIFFFDLLDVAKGIGIITGCILSGYILEIFQNFSIIAMTATICTFLGIISLQYIDDDSATTLHKTESTKNYYHQIDCLKNLNYRKNWDKILIKSIITFSYVIYSSRFAFLIVFNYHVGIIIVGYTVAYQYMLKFASECSIFLVKQSVLDKNQLFELSLITCGVTLPGLYYAPTYEFYLIIYIPMILSYTMLNSLLQENIFKLKTNTNQAFIVINNLVKILTPILFGICCQIIGVKAFKLLTIFPIISCFYLVRKRLSISQVDDDDDDNDDDKLKDE